MALLLLVYTLRHGMLNEKKSKQTKKKNKKQKTKTNKQNVLINLPKTGIGSIPIAELGILVVMSRR